jgi:hypothetical protein
VQPKLHRVLAAAARRWRVATVHKLVALLAARLWLHRGCKEKTEVSLSFFFAILSSFPN